MWSEALRGPMGIRVVDTSAHAWNVRVRDPMILTAVVAVVVRILAGEVLEVFVAQPRTTIVRPGCSSRHHVAAPRVVAMVVVEADRLRR